MASSNRGVASVEESPKEGGFLAGSPHLYRQYCGSRCSKYHLPDKTILICHLCSLSVRYFAIHIHIFTHVPPNNSKRRYWGQHLSTLNIIFLFRFRVDVWAYNNFFFLFALYYFLIRTYLILYARTSTRKRWREMIFNVDNVALSNAPSVGEADLSSAFIISVSTHLCDTYLCAKLILNLGGFHFYHI